MQPHSSPQRQPEQTRAAPPEALLKTWSVADVRVFLNSRDLRGLAELCYTNGVNGADLAQLHEATVIEELRLTPFQARRLQGARAALLAGETGDGGAIAETHAWV